MPASAQRSDDCAHIDFRYSTAGHNVHFISHTCDGKNSVKVFHLDHFVDQKGEIRDVIVGGYGCNHNFNTVDIVAGCGLNHIV